MNAPRDAERRPVESDTTLSGERWRRVKSAFHEALERPVDDREPFIRATCRGDAALEALLRSLLASDQPAADFLEAPAAARLGVLSSSRAVVNPGDRLGVYEIVEQCGAGGMGEVYRARDHRLARDVALKILRADVRHDRGHQRRLEREAQATAALDHPNICSIFEVGEQDGLVWIAMQYVQGETLAERLRRGALEVPAALDLATQVAGALSVAHAAGMIHRDVKPDNVILTTSGQAKVLDFGLATVAGDQGRCAGTLPYMSPEQVRGEPLDGRTDVYSLCVTMYEALTARRPFPGTSDDELATDILQVTPQSLAVLAPGLPADLVRLVQKGLEKDPARRHQTMAALVEELASLRRRLELPSVTRLFRGSTAVAAGLVLALAGTAVWWSAVVWRQQERLPEYERLTDFPGFVHSPAVSPDGSQLAFVVGTEPFTPGPGGELYVKPVPGGEARALTNDGTRKFAPTFSPDVSQIVYSVDSSSFSVPLRGGGAPKLFKRNVTGVRWIAPRQLLFSELAKVAPNLGIVTAHEDWTSSRPIYRPSSAQGMARLSEGSPDGRHVLVVEMDRTRRLPCRLVPFDGSSAGIPVGPAGAECTAAAWSPSGQWMYFAATVDGESHLWRQRFPDGAPQQITFGPNEQRGIVIERDGHSAITTVAAAQSTVWYHGHEGDRPVSVEGYAYQPLVAPDGDRVFYLRQASRRSTALGELWAYELATRQSQRVQPGFLIRSYDLSADGTQLVFDDLDEAGRSRIWVMPANGSQPPRPLTPAGGPTERRAFFGRRSGRIYFQQERSPGLYSLNRMNDDGTGRQHLTDDGVHFLVNMSPDERWAVSWKNGLVQLYPIAGGAAVPLCSCAFGPVYNDPPGVAWSGDERSMYLVGGRGTLVVPWAGDAISRVSPGISLKLWEKLAGAHHVPGESIAPGRTLATHAFVRRSRQGNLFRVRLPAESR